MGASKNSDYKKCGNILIDIKTIKSPDKIYAIICGFCDAEYDQIKIFSQHLEEKHLEDFDNVELVQVAEPENNSLLTVEQETIKIEEQSDANGIRSEVEVSPFTMGEVFQNAIDSGLSRVTRCAEELDMPPIKREHKDTFDENEEYWDPQYNKRFHLNTMSYSDEEMDTFQITSDYTNEKEYPLDDEISGNSKNDEEEFIWVRPVPWTIDHKIYEFLLQGKSHTQIASLLNICTNSVRKVEKSFPNIPFPSRKGRKQILAEKAKQHILRLFQQEKLKTPFEIRKQLAECENIQVSLATVNRTLRSAGLIGRLSLTKEEKQIRLDFAKKFVSWTAEDWAKVLWTNETKIKLFASKNSKLGDDKSKISRIKLGEESIMVWSCMMAKGIGTIHRIIDRMTVKSYVDILDTNLSDSVEKLGVQTTDIVFEHYNNHKHCAKFTHKWLNDQGYNVLDWPSHSPDLNPIQHLWNTLKKDVRRKSDNVNELWNNVQSAWNSINPRDCKSLVDSMPQRLQAVITAEGGYANFKASET